MAKNFRWLVIEDERLWVEILEAHSNSGERCAVSTRGEAEPLLRSYPFRCISHDLAIPHANQTLLSRNNGILLLDERNLLARRLVYTGYKNNSEEFNALVKAGAGGFLLLAKSATNAVQGETAEASAMAWCAVQQHLLGYALPNKWDARLRAEVEDFVGQLAKAVPLAMEPWAKAYWRLAQQHLPQPLAEAAQRFAQAQDQRPAHQRHSLDRNGVLALNDFREWAFWLAQAQTALLLRHVGARFALPQAADNNSFLAQQWLAHHLPALAALKADVPGAFAWQRYLGLEHKANEWHSLALDGMHALRQLRNEQAHGLKPQPVVIDGIQKPMYGLMDLASFWANNPLFTLARREQGRWRAKVLRGLQGDGSDWVLPSDVQWPKDAYGNITGPEPDGVYQLLWRFEADEHEAKRPLLPAVQAGWVPPGKPRPVVIDWSPYLRWVPSQEGVGTELMLLTQPHAQRAQHWYAQGFAGKARVLRLSEAQSRQLHML